jgi:putative ABC transport system permease protein
MFQNYLKTAVRNLLRYKGFAVINILSLTIGIIGCMVIGLFVWDEKQFDKNIPDGENIYRLYEERKDNENITYSAAVPPMYTTFLQQHYPEVDTATRIMMLGDKYLVEAGNKRGYEEKGIFVDPSIFNFFSLKFSSGDPATALTAPNTIVLSQDLATRYFGKENPVGKSVFVNKDTFEVKGVMAPLPDHFHLDFAYLMPISAVGFDPERMQKWTWHQFYSYVKLKPAANVQQLQEKFQAHIRKEIFPTLTQTGSTYLPFFQPLKDVHLKSADFGYDNAIRGNASYVNGLTIIALFVLLIACFNFINLATARSLRRAKEIGVRKVIGADRRQLIIQFIGETILLSVISMVIAILATWLIVPALNQFSGKAISFNPVTNPALAGIMLLAGMLIGVAAGIYPALVLSGFQPIKVLKNMKLVGSGGSSWLRPALVVVQFSLSVLLIISTLVVYRQTNYLNNKDLGFSKDQVVYFQVRDEFAEKLETFKNEMRTLQGVVSVTSGYGLPGDAFAGDGIILPKKDGAKEYGTKLFIGDHDYIKTLGLHLIAGRDFSREMATDEKEAFIINETAVKEFGLGTPERAIGQPMHWKEWQPADSLQPVKKGKIIGVVRDFHYQSLHEKVTASVIQIYPQATFTIAAKLRAAEVKNTLASLNRLWNQFAPGYPFDYKFMDESFGKMYSSEQKLSTLLWIFALMAIAVGCMGLFGLAAFSAEQRTKEIGIRKVLGASAVNIAALLSKSFVRLVLISSLIAFPLAWWAMNKWLEDFSYRIEIGWWIFVVAGVTCLLVALVTVSFHAVRAAVSNPVKSLRTE